VKRKKKIVSEIIQPALEEDQNSSDQSTQQEQASLEHLREKQRHRQSLKRKRVKKNAKIALTDKEDREEQQHERDNQEEKTTTNDGDTKVEVEVEVTRIKSKKKTKKKKKTPGKGILSFESYEDDDMLPSGEDDQYSENESRKRKHKRKKKKFRSRVGFGGGFAKGDDDADAKTYTEEEDKIPQLPSLYGKDALDSLKQQQKKYIITDEDKASPQQNAPKQTEESRQINIGHLDEENKNRIPTNIEDFIPLNSKSFNTTAVLSGDQAFEHTDENIEATMNDPFTKRLSASLPDDDEGQWEDQIEKRGLSTTSAIKTQKDSPIGIPMHVNESSSKQSLNKIKQSLSNTIDNLSESSNQLESSLRLRKVELNNLTQPSRSNAYQNEKDVHTHGKGFEFFQQLRFRLTNHVGALREVKKKMDLITDALQDMMKEIGNKRNESWKEEENDVIHWFQNAKYDGTNNWIKEIIGREIGSESHTNSKDLPTETAVDEFGRDLSHLAVLERNKRVNKRRKIRAKLKKITAPDQDFFLIAKEQVDKFIDAEFWEPAQFEEQRSRFLALINAVEVATMGSDIDDEYLSISSLCSIFVEWRNQYSDEYQQCYADLSLSDLLGILVLVEIYRDLDLLGININWKESNMLIVNLNDLVWFQELNKQDWTGNQKTNQNANADSQISKEKQQSSVKGNILKKIVVPHFLQIFEKAYNPYSPTQSRNMSSYFSSLNLDEDMELKKKAWHLMQACWKKNLDDRAIPVLNHMKLNSSSSSECNDCDSEDECEAIIFSIRQVLKMQQFILNISKYWIPAFKKEGYQDELTQDIIDWFSRLIFMDIISNRILPCLTSWRNIHDEKYKIYSCMVLKEIYDAVYDLGWLQEEKMIFFSSSLRAAKLSYGL